MKEIYEEPLDCEALETIGKLVKGKKYKVEYKYITSLDEELYSIIGDGYLYNLKAIKLL